MKSKTAVLALAAVALFTPACEKHSWAESKQLYQTHESKEGEHGAKDAAHGEKTEGHGAEKH